ncbi:MAG: biopolymer transporter ExbD [Deltaproteobacteria bacterium]|jgi:biopolymer transport protein TolR|nr:biopolymer transporter ExbD [SAR324 cluster bacterium]NBR21840.1 biopolymer transporter ExbD [Pseudomonadota bacterium]GIR32857.1 MAG: protein TolR [Deltaproteobacteria bacterium]MDP6384092.1 biopolymer transporter ExbD [SAR324 cluster bacterium]MDP7405375.1 biopolymer transporter ExbD [SAR324 cluster bacterium]|tara:strand:+ start:403 stop:831 length:429 start_codon:yes stop_codon:yes gene_type:complete
MGGGDSSGGKGKKLVSEINITPLVDTLLVLLIIFMVTAPAMTRTIGIDLPSADGARAEKMEVDEEKEFLVVGISVDDQIVFEEKNYSQSDFMNQFSTLVAGMEPEKVFIQADKNVAYDRLVQVMVFLQNQGHEKIGLVFEDQ